MQPQRRNAALAARLRAARAALLLSALLLAAPAGAQAVLPLGGLATDPAAPVEIEADRLEVSQSDGSARFTGNVLVVQGALRLTAELLLVDYAPAASGPQTDLDPQTASDPQADSDPQTDPDPQADPGARAAPATRAGRGRIRKLTAQGDVLLATATEQAEAREAVYDIEARRITMTGDVLLTQGGSIISGQELVVNLDDGTGSMSGRVRTVLEPETP